MSSSITPLGTAKAGSDWQKNLNELTKLGRVKAVFTTGVRNPAKFELAKNQFKEAYMSQVELVAASLPKGAVGPFLDKAYNSMDRILDNTFGDLSRHLDKKGQYTKKAHRQMVKNANKLAHGSFKKIEKQILQDTVLLNQIREETHGSVLKEGGARPQVFIRAKGEEGGRINLRRSAPPLETLVFRGGGAKGIANPSALAELERAGCLSHVKHVVGTSAGALTALSLASGYDSERFARLIEDNPMNKMSDKLPGFSKKYPMVKLWGHAGWKYSIIGAGLRKAGGGSGQHAMMVADKASATRVSEFLRQSWDTEKFQLKLAEITQNETRENRNAITERLLLLRANPDFESNRTGKMVTFSDLKLLSQLAPETFKELTLTGFDASRKETVYFNAEKFPNMPIALAGRISMSIPVAFQKVRFDPGDGKGMRKWVDGGVGSNMPSEVVLKDLKGRDKELAQAKTMLFTYSDQGNWSGKLHGSGSFSGSVKTFFKGLAGGNWRLNDVNVADNRKVYDGGLNTFVVHHYDIDTMHLQASEKRVNLAKAQSTLMTLKTIENRQELDFTQSFESVDEAYEYLTREEKMAVLEHKKPKPENYVGGEDSLVFKAELRLFELVVNEFTQN